MSTKTGAGFKSRTIKKMKGGTLANDINTVSQNMHELTTEQRAVFMDIFNAMRLINTVPAPAPTPPPAPAPIPAPVPSHRRTMIYAPRVPRRNST